MPHDDMSFLTVNAAALRFKLASEELLDQPSTGIAAAGLQAPMAAIGTGFANYKPPVVPQRPQTYREQARSVFAGKARSALNSWWERMRARYRGGL